MHSTRFVGMGSSAFDTKLSVSLKCILKQKTPSKSHTKTKQICKLALDIAFCEKVFQKGVDVSL